MRDLIKLICIFCVSLGFAGMAQASQDMTVKNDSNSNLDVYFLALGCLKSVDDLWVVCKKETIKPGQEFKYTFGTLTARREVIMRPEAVTLLIANNFDMDPKWGQFAKDWASAFAKVFKEGPKGLYAYKDLFDKLKNIKKMVDLSHELSKWNANLSGKHNLEFGEYDAKKIIANATKKAQEAGFNVGK